VLIAASPLAAQDTRSSPATGPATSAQKNAGRASARGPLPDPALLDGSAQLPEKKSEYGMLGEFEIPGDENSKSDKVGAQQPPPGMSSGGGQADPKGAQGPQGAMAQGGGAADGQPQAGQEPPKGGALGGPGGGQNDPNAKAEGIQVAELQTDESAGPAGEPDPNTRKPQPVAIGDSTRQIKPAANAPGVVGAQVPAGNTQQMEKATGGAAKGSSGNSGNRGVEKGRAMPAGL
jgi:hypothetical protein